MSKKWPLNQILYYHILTAEEVQEIWIFHASFTFMLFAPRSLCEFISMRNKSSYIVYCCSIFAMGKSHNTCIKMVTKRELLHTRKYPCSQYALFKSTCSIKVQEWVCTIHVKSTCHAGAYVNALTFKLHYWDRDAEFKLCKTI